MSWHLTWQDPVALALAALGLLAVRWFKRRLDRGRRSHRVATESLKQSRPTHPRPPPKPGQVGATPSGSRSPGPLVVAERALSR